MQQPAHTSENAPGARASRAPTNDLSDEEIRALALFEGVDFHTIRPLLSTCSVRRLEPGEVLIAAGRPNQSLHVLLSGCLSVRLASPESAPIAEIADGESVGELSMIDRQPTSAYVVAEARSRVLTIDEQLMWVLVNTSHAIASNLLFTLARRLRYGNQIIFEHHERLEQYRFHATVDALTGLFNRHWLGSMLPRQMHRSRKCEEPLCLLMLDIDHFKQYNDRHGHVAGDQALSAVATTMRETLRPTDMAARYGGEEFLVMLPTCPLDAGQAVAERLRQAVARTPVRYTHGEELPGVTVSVGIAADDGHETLEGFIAAADAAMYRAKAAGRDRVCT